MRKTIFRVVVFILLLLTKSSFAFNQTDVCRYQIQAVRCFGLQRYDSCVHYCRLLSNGGCQNHDTLLLRNSWFTIAIVNLLENKKTNAEAAWNISKLYIRKESVLPLSNIYHSFISFQADDYHETFSLLEKTDPATASLLTPRLGYLCQLIKGVSYFRLSHYNKAKATLYPLLNSLKEKRDTNWFGYAECNLWIARILANDNEYAPSIPFFVTSMKVYETNQIFNLDWITGYRSLLNSLQFTKQKKLREYYYKNLTLLLERNKLMSKYQVEYYTIKGTYCYAKSLYQEAIDAYLRVYNSPQNSLLENEELVKKIIWSYYAIQKYDKAIEWYNKNVSVQKDDYCIGIAAFCYMQLGEVKKSKEYIGYLKRTTIPDNLNLLYVLSRYYDDIKDYKQAGYYHELSLKYWQKRYGEYNPYVYTAYIMMGNFYWYSKADYRSALEYYQKATYALTGGHVTGDIYHLTDIEKSTDDEKLMWALNDKAEAFYQLSKHRKNKQDELRDLKAGYDNFKLSIELIQRYKRSLPGEDQKLLYADLTKRKYPNIIKVCLELYYKTGDQSYAVSAFQYAEKSKASLLLSSVRGVNAQKMHLLPDSIKGKEEQISVKTVLYSRNRLEEYNKPKPDLVKIDRLNTSLSQLKIQQDSLVSFYKKKYPTYYNTKYNTEVVSPDKLRSLIRPNEAVVQYSVTSDFMVIFLITNKEFRIFTDTLKHSFYADVETYRTRLSRFTYTDLNDTAVKAFEKVSNRVYSHLVKPIEPYINGCKLIVIADDVLNQVPFEPLVTHLSEPGKRSSFHDMAYLIRDHAINYSYSGTLYAMDMHESNYEHAKLLAVAPSYKQTKFTNLTEKDLESVRGDTSEILPIPGTQDEVRQVKRVFGGELLLNEKATEAGFATKASDYDILHLAMHGMLNNEYPMFSKLLFYAVNDSADDGLMNTYEIYNMRIKAPLVVLSACNSGNGKSHRGEGVISLARGFFIAGARGIVMTLWSVADKTSSKLMGDFYSNLASHQSIGDALRNAKLQYIDHSDQITSHPYFWAGYISLGNTSSTFEVDKYSKKYWYWSLGLGLLVFGAIVWWIVWRKYRGDI